MRKIALLFVPLFFLFGCQKDIEIRRENEITYQSELFLANVSGYHYSIFDLGKLNNSERGTFEGTIYVMRTFHPVMEYYLKRLEEIADYSIKIEISPNMPLDGNSCYEPYTKTIYFRNANEMSVMNTMHEVFHLVQEFILEYDMQRSSCQRDIEYEAHIAHDLMMCFSYNRRPTQQGAIGYPSGNRENDYLESIYNWVMSNNVSGTEIELKFNEWINSWGKYTDKNHCKNYRPQLIYNVLEMIHKFQGNK